jgi:glutaredoxin 3
MGFTLFTTQTCAFCHQLKKLLGAKSIDYETIDVTDNLEKRLELQQKYNATTVPILVREDGEYMVGLNMPKFFAMIK